MWNGISKLNHVRFPLAVIVLLSSLVSLTSCSSVGMGPAPVANCDPTVELPGADLLSVERDKAIFWSGQSEGIRAQDVAEKLAYQKHGITLEMRLKEKNMPFPMPIGDQNTSAVLCAWTKLSAEYAKRALGKVRAVIGKSRRAGSIWDTIELPSLAQNPKITEIIMIDPATCRPTRILKAVDLDS